MADPHFDQFPSELLADTSHVWFVLAFIGALSAVLIYLIADKSAGREGRTKKIKRHDCVESVMSRSENTNRDLDRNEHADSATTCPKIGKYTECWNDLEHREKHEESVSCATIQHSEINSLFQFMRKQIEFVEGKRMTNRNGEYRCDLGEVLRDSGIILAAQSLIGLIKHLGTCNGFEINQHLPSIATDISGAQVMTEIACGRNEKRLVSPSPTNRTAPSDSISDNRKRHARKLSVMSCILAIIFTLSISTEYSSCMEYKLKGNACEYSKNDLISMERNQAFQILLELHGEVCLVEDSFIDNEKTIVNPTLSVNENHDLPLETKKTEKPDAKKK